ncbi:hypothetical protein RAN53_10040 [Halomonas sp. SSL-5]|uniref:hypothetical protein n=1 Tax=Halomonas sp. SSL-5 TaxID=3065855 RepID=UPI00273A5175|nr:hypothetical protein [Halomonas sp. SSL-5]MDY7116692.1 hypothetical protein [Halomonas sp. SSL-5]
MPDATESTPSRDRLRAVLSCGLVFSLAGLAGCASGKATPLASSLAALWPDTQAAEHRAAELPYASLIARLGNAQGLLVMGTQAGDITLWPSAQGGTLELHDGGLQSFSGGDVALLGTAYAPQSPWHESSPARFTLTRHWRDAEGFVQRGEAEGVMRCEAPGPVRLPLGERVLERCEVSLAWASGASSEASWWRDPDSRRLWALEEQPWPDALTLRWQVARHWW